MRKTLLEKRRERIRTKLRLVNSGRPRLTVHRTNKHIYAQIIDDVKAITIASASTLEKGTKENLKNGGNVSAAEQVGKMLADKATKLGIKDVIFDRSGYRYHGRIKALADAARTNGLEF